MRNEKKDIFLGELEVDGNEKCGDKFLWLKLKAFPFKFTPGQFLMLQTGNFPSTFLNRPFAIAGVKDGKIDIIYKIAGKGTEILSHRKKGEKLRAIFPLGRGFELKENKYILLAGGTGIASILPCARFLEENKKEFIFILGLKSVRDVNVEKIIEPGILEKTCITTEDGSYGRRGTALDELKKWHEGNEEIIAGGPEEMLKNLLKIVKNKRKVQLTLEVRMGCGTGVCFSCAVETVRGRKRACLEGPVFRGDEVVFK